MFFFFDESTEPWEKSTHDELSENTKNQTIELINFGTLTKNLKQTNYSTIIFLSSI